MYITRKHGRNKAVLQRSLKATARRVITGSGCDTTGTWPTRAPPQPEQSFVLKRCKEQNLRRPISEKLSAAQPFPGQERMWLQQGIGETSTAA